MRLLDSGTRALLLDLDGLDDARTWHTALTRAVGAGELTGVADVVPAASTVLVVAATPADVPGLRAGIEQLAERGVDAAATAADDAPVVTVPVVYDGEDLAEAAAALGIEPAELVRRHTSEEWTVAFAGFAPGFGYCVGREFAWDTPRRSEPRTRVPAGSVALAGEFTAVYPQDSPGGWQFIGRTDAVLFDPDATPPAPMRAGVRIRFEEVTR